MIALPYLNNKAVMVHVVDEDALVGSRPNVCYSQDMPDEWWIRIWKINRLKDGISDGNFIFDDSRRYLRSSYFDITRKMLFVCAEKYEFFGRDDSAKIVLA